MNNTKYANQIQGEIVIVETSGKEGAGHLTVAYRIENTVYFVREPIRFKEGKKRPFAMMDSKPRKPLMSCIACGAKVTVAYDPENPKDAIIAENAKP